MQPLNHNTAHRSLDKYLAWRDPNTAQSATDAQHFSRFREGSSRAYGDDHGLGAAVGEGLDRGDEIGGGFEVDVVLGADGGDEVFFVTAAVDADDLCAKRSAVLN
jgi:hypothetical protein